MIYAMIFFGILITVIIFGIIWLIIATISRNIKKRC